jgi:hypothetical protein
MILQSLMKAIREQNWFAVALEFIIVVFGVVIGFQVTAWNAERQDRSTEVQIIDRLHNEIMGLEENRWDWAVERASTRESLLSASQKLFGEIDEDLTPDECVALTMSHIFNSPSLALPVIAELESTGDLDLVNNRDVRAAITRYLQTNTWMSEMDVALNHEILNLPPDHPELFYFVAPAIGADWNPFFDGSARCDTAAMRNNRAFLNALADNISKGNFYMTVMLNVAEGFTDLHTAVDAELGLSHEDATH